MNCDFCKMEYFTDTTSSLSSGWIAENHLACSRLITHLLSHVRDIMNIQDYNLMKAFDYVIESWSCLISRLMTRAEVNTVDIDLYLKIFLRFFHNFEDISEVGGQSYLWTRRGNFLSLLNLPKQIEQFGHIANYWEGINERHIQVIKPFIQRMRTTSSFLTTKMTHMYNQKAINEMYNVIKDSNKAPFQNVRTYKNIQEVETRILNGDPISLIKVRTSDEEPLCLAIIVDGDIKKNVRMKLNVMMKYKCAINVMFP